LLLAGILAPAQASADGLPVPGGVDTTNTGVISSTGAQRFLAIPRGGDTLLEKVVAGSGQIMHSTWLHGLYSVPGVSINGDTAGISQNGRSLILIRPRTGYPQAETVMALIAPGTLEVKRRIKLDGDFSFDAISPDGKTAYLIQYPDPRDRTSYRLRTYDLQSGRLAPGSLLPENEPAEKMRGFPLRRASSEDGRWQYTLYDGGLTYYGPSKAGEPFVHAIDTVGRRTLCIDLDWIPPNRLSRVDLQMSDSGDAVEVIDPDRGLLGTIDTATGVASEATATPALAPTDEAGGGQSTLVIVAIVLGAAGLLGGALRLRSGTRRRRGGGGRADVTA
jgi:hypothetical protein